jgi:UDP-glucose 4-epimerase
MKKILVTGGAGYIASNLIKRLILEDEIQEIVSLDNYFSGSENNHHNSQKLTYIKGNTWDIDSIFIKNDFDTIFHFGEYSRIVHSFEDFEFVEKSIVRGTLEVLKFCLKNNSKLIYSASSSKFGNGGLDENLSPYAFFKAKNVELIKNFKQWFNLNYEICYFFNVYGENHIKEGKYATVIAIFENQYLLKKPLTVVGDGIQSRDFTHINDVCSGIMKVCQINRNGEFYLRYGENFKIIDVARKFGTTIEFIQERPGERFTSEDFESNTEHLLKWKANINLYQYIEDFITKNG